MKEKRSPVISFLHVIYILISATVLSYILAFVIREWIGKDIFVEILLFPAEIFAPFPLNLLGLFTVGLGFLLVFFANFHLLFIGKIGLEDREPFHTPSTLVTSGPYRFSRNPIYFGVVLITLGLAIITISLTILICTIGLYLFFWKVFIKWEEEKLDDTFGEDYREYKQRVRRWI